MDVGPQQAVFGNSCFVITDNDIEALKTGKVLFVREEYGVFLKYEGGQNNE